MPAQSFHFVETLGARETCLLSKLRKSVRIYVRIYYELRITIAPIARNYTRAEINREISLIARDTYLRIIEEIMRCSAGRETNR